MKGLLNRVGIKSVQRGTYNSGGNIVINKVDPSKCLVLINGGYNESWTSFPYLGWISDTSFSIYCTNSDASSGSWQVIEFA